MQFHADAGAIGVSIRILRIYHLTYPKFVDLIAFKHIKIYHLDGYFSMCWFINRPIDNRRRTVAYNDK